MLRGYQKRVYVIKKTDSPLFEEAYFLMKPCVKTPCAEDEVAMLREAERIVSEVYGFAAEYGKRSHTKHGFRTFGARFLAFLLGAAVSSAIIGSAALLLTFA